MSQESYADYSIIHKYLEQQKLHEEELQRYIDENEELSTKLEVATKELQSAKDELENSQSRAEELQQKVTERDNEIRRLTTTINTLNQKISVMMNEKWKPVEKWQCIDRKDTNLILVN